MTLPLTVSVLDYATFTNDLRNCIATFPVKARHQGREFDVRVLSTTDVITAVEGGTLDNMTMSVVAARDDFGDILPKSMDDFYVLVQDDWVLFQVRDVPDFYDPRVHILQVNLQSPQKGIM
jgi:hypothetical protein